MDRRTFLTASIASTTLLTAQQHTTAQTQASSPISTLGSPVGRIPTRSSSDITASSLSVGFETLDRHGFSPKKTYPYLAKLGVKWARCQTGWGRCETKRGQYNFSWLDEAVDALLAIGIQPWFNLGYGNRLYIPGATNEAAVGWTPVFDEAAMLAWLRYTTALTQHFSGRVKHYEIWNEPNHPGFWRPRIPKSSDYIKLVARTAPAIRTILPDAIIIGGVCAGLPLDFITHCFRDGLQEYIDVLSFHPYRERPEKKYSDEIARLHRLLAKYNTTCALWQGENGCPSVGGPGNDSAGALSDIVWDETRQAKWLLRRVLTDLKHELAMTSYFHTVDLVGYRGSTNYKGLLRAKDYTPKPAYFAYQHLCGLFDADTSVTENFSPLECTPVYSGSKNMDFEVQQVSFARKGKLLYGCWYPSDLQNPWTEGTVTLHIKVSDNARLSDPILLDPLSGDIFELNNVQISRDTVTVNALPLRDYPLLLSDRSLLDI